MNLTKAELELIRGSLGFGVMHSRSESETAEFVLLRLKVEKEMVKMCAYCSGTRFHRDDSMEFVRCEHCSK